VPPECDRQVTILDDDQDTLEAVTADLNNLRTRDDLTERQQNKVDQLLTAIATLCPTKKSRT